MKHENRFWTWFVQHEEELFEFNPSAEIEREKLFDEVAKNLQRVHRDLTFEFGPSEAKREFVVSAGGIKEAFPAVTRLADAAPRLERWQIIAFRPRRTPIMAIEINEKHVEPKDALFTLVDNGKKAGIYLFIPGFRQDDIDFTQIGYLLLDEALGEYDVEIRLGLIKMLPLDSHTEGERHPLPELPVLFDQLVSRLEGRSAGPS